MQCFLLTPHTINTVVLSSQSVEVPLH